QRELYHHLANVARSRVHRSQTPPARHSPPRLLLWRQSPRLSMPTQLSPLLRERKPSPTRGARPTSFPRFQNPLPVHTWSCSPALRDQRRISRKSLGSGCLSECPRSSRLSQGPAIPFAHLDQ